MRRLIPGLSAGLVLLIAAVHGFAEPIPLEAFADPSQFEEVTLSPDGRYLAAEIYRDDRYMAVIFDLENIDNKKPLVVETDPWSVAGLKWANNNRLLVTVLHSVEDFSGVYYVSQLTAFDADGRNPLVFKSSGSRVRHWFLGDSIVDLLPDDPGHVLISWNPDNPRQPRLYKLDVYTSKLKLFQKGRRGVQAWITDLQGNVRIGAGIDGGDYEVIERPSDGRKWKLLLEKPVEERTVFFPFLIDRTDSDIAYVFSDLNTDTVGLYKYRLSSASFVEEVFRHPKYDLQGAVFNREGTEIHGVTFVSSGFETHWLKKVEPELLDKIRPRLPGYRLYINSKSRGYKRLVIYATASDRPGRYYLYEPKTDRLQLLSYTYPQLEGKPLSVMQTANYRARDGLEIEAIVSLPVGADYPPSEPLPAVIMPHGGPVARDFADFDPMVQFLTSRGYAVLQMNFRGSSGYGKKFRRAGERQWGQAMQDDVTDGTRWLIEQGIADPDRICIVGGSYGGYVALMGAVKTPDLFQCAVSVNGVSDLKDLLRQNSRSSYYGWVANGFIAGWGDGAMLKENSPARRADEIRIPILLAHSTKDSVVNFTHSKKMARALKKAGKDYRFIKLENGDHSLSLGGVRPVFFRAMEEFLAENLQ